jgi:hypothetical protein
MPRPSWFDELTMRATEFQRPFILSLSKDEGRELEAGLDHYLQLW